VVQGKQRSGTRNTWLSAANSSWLQSQGRTAACRQSRQEDEAEARSAPLKAARASVPPPFAEGSPPAPPPFVALMRLRALPKGRDRKRRSSARPVLARSSTQHGEQIYRKAGWARTRPDKVCERRGFAFPVQTWLHGTTATGATTRLSGSERSAGPPTWCGSCCSWQQNLLASQHIWKLFTRATSNQNTWRGRAFHEGKHRFSCACTAASCAIATTPDDRTNAGVRRRRRATLQAIGAKSVNCPWSCVKATEVKPALLVSAGPAPFLQSTLRTASCCMPMGMLAVSFKLRVTRPLRSATLRTLIIRWAPCKGFAGPCNLMSR
jgi:hypothetical protein